MRRRRVDGVRAAARSQAADAQHRLVRSTQVRLVGAVLADGRDQVDARGDLAHALVDVKLFEVRLDLVVRVNLVLLSPF